MEADAKKFAANGLGKPAFHGRGDLYFGRFIYIAARRACESTPCFEILRENKGFTPRGAIGRQAKRGISCPIAARLAPVLTHIDKSSRSALLPAGRVFWPFSGIAAVYHFLGHINQGFSVLRCGAVVADRAFSGKLHSPRLPAKSNEFTLD